ncbi:hypothetical protein BC827DRAFT_1236686, partial [Russula dissimulans]
MTAPLLTRLQVYFSNQLTFDLPHLLQFLNTTENLRFRGVTLTFREDVFSVIVYPNEAGMYALYMDVGCRDLAWQVASAAQIFRVLRSAFSAVENLTLKNWRYGVSLEWGAEGDRTQWRDLLSSFSNLKTLRVGLGLVSQLSRSLQPEGEESPVELLPELKELSFPTASIFASAFTEFRNARRVAGRPVIVVR